MKRLEVACLRQWRSAGGVVEKKVAIACVPSVVKNAGNNA